MLAPEIQELLKALDAANLPPFESLSPTDARRQYEMLAKARPAPVIPIARTEDLIAPGPHGDFRVRVYWPNEQPSGAVLYFHGGGHVFGSIDTHDAITRAVCAGTQAFVASVEYHKAPEHKFPVAVEDAFAALTWLHQNATRLGFDRERIAVAGDSAGGNLAAVVSLMARDAGGRKLCAQALLYPVTDYTLSSPSHQKYATGCGPLTGGLMKWFQGHYLRTEADAQDWRASPLKSRNLSGLPPAILVTPQCDVLHDEGASYAEALRQAGVPVEHRDYPGMIHGFFGMAPVVRAATEAQRYVCGALKAALTAKQSG
jgi:acetyl esterase